MNHTQLQDESEIACVSRFIETYNVTHGTNFTLIQKNPIQNEVDIFCIDESNGTKIQVQVKKSDPTMAGDVGKLRGVPSAKKNQIHRHSTGILENVINNINNVENKYKEQNKNMSKIILLLDDLGDPPDFILHQTKEKIPKNSFKEIWMTRRRQSPYRLY